MDTLMQWFLVHIVSQLLLPIVMIGFLAMIAGVKPDGLITGLLKLYTAVFKAAADILVALVKIIWLALKHQAILLPSRWKKFVICLADDYRDQSRKQGRL